jgi:hypothetical protein
MLINRFKIYRSRKQELKIINNLIKATWNYSDYYKLNKDKTIEKLGELLKMIGGR